MTPGRFQVEAGYTHAESRAAGTTVGADEAPQLLVRVGLLPWLEFRAIHDGWGAEHARPGGSLGSGLNDGALGLKFRLCEEAGLRPATCLNAHTSIPVGAPGRTTGRSDPDFRFLFAHSLPDGYGIGYNLGAAWSTAEETPGDRDTTAAFEYTVTVGKDLTEAWGAFVEGFGDAALHGGPPTTLLDAGVTYSPRANLQFDLAGGVGLSDSAEDWFGGVGISYRYPD